MDGSTPFSTIVRNVLTGIFVSALKFRKPQISFSMLRIEAHIHAPNYRTEFEL
jgi:hypothetical protein